MSGSSITGQETRPGSDRRRSAYGAPHPVFNRDSGFIWARFWTLTLIAALFCLPGAARADAVQPGPGAVKHILAFGDSLTAGYGLNPEQGFTARLGVALAARGLAVEILNGGVSGDTTSGGLARLDRALDPTPGPKPDAVILELGANDALRGLDPDRARANLAAMLTRIKAAGIPVLLCGMRAPTNWGPEYATAFDGIFPALADEFRVPLYPFFLDGVALDPALNQRDMLHPNPRGVDVIVTAIIPSVAALIAKPAP